MILITNNNSNTICQPNIYRNENRNISIYMKEKKLIYTPNIKNGSIETKEIPDLDINRTTIESRYDIYIKTVLHCKYIF